MFTPDSHHTHTFSAFIKLLSLSPVRRRPRRLKSSESSVPPWILMFDLGWHGPQVVKALSSASLNESHIASLPYPSADWRYLASVIHSFSSTNLRLSRGHQELNIRLSYVSISQVWYTYSKFKNHFFSAELNLMIFFFWISGDIPLRTVQRLLPGTRHSRLSCPYRGLIFIWKAPAVPTSSQDLLHDVPYPWNCMSKMHFTTVFRSWTKVW